MSKMYQPAVRTLSRNCNVEDHKGRGMESSSRKRNRTKRDTPAAMKHLRVLFLFACAFCLSVTPSAWAISEQQHLFTSTHAAMGTTYSLFLYTSDAERARKLSDEVWKRSTASKICSATIAKPANFLASIASPRMPPLQRIRRPFAFSPKRSTGAAPATAPLRSPWES